MLFAVATGVFAAGDSVVVFNEVMYHPATNEAGLEWVELHNQMAVDVDISAWRLRGGITYDFPADTVLSGGGYAVVAIDPAAVESAHGIANVLGPFGGRLSNAGETLRLRTHDGRIMDELTYDHEGEWPPAADGSGVSLSKIEEDMGTADPGNWGQSLALGGTPGNTNAVYLPAAAPGVVFNEIAAATGATFWVELHNAAPTNVPVGGYRIVGTGFDAGEYTLPSQTIPGGGFLVLDEATLGFRAYDENKLFLYDSAATVRDAAVVKNRPRGRYPDGMDEWLRTTATAAGASNVVTLTTDIVINEIMYHHQPSYDPFAESDEGWIELYNRGTGSVDLAGWSFDDGIGFQFPSNTVLSSGEYLVVADDSAAFSAAFPGVTNVIGDYSGNLAFGGERIILHDALGNPADVVRYYDGHPWPDYADGGGSSLELRDPRADNNNPAAWADSDETGKSAWQTVTYRGVATDDGNGIDMWHEFALCLLAPGEVLLDDFSVVEDPDGAAVEFMQNGDFQSDAVGAAPAAWRVLGTHGSHGRTAVVDDPDAPGNKALHLVSTGDYKHWHNHIETTHASGEQVVAGQEYEISFRAKWLAGSPQVNTRLYFNWLQRTTNLAVPHTNGTPGRVNSRYVANVGPTYSEPAHAPVVPAVSEVVTVSVIAADPDGVADMHVFYSVSGGAWESNTMAEVDGRFQGTIPGQVASSRVQFYVQGRDSQGAISTWPAAGPDSRAMYRVEDGYADLSTLHNLRMVMTPADRDAMYVNTELLSNYRRGGTVIYDERLVYYDVGIRLKGSPFGRNSGLARGFNIAFSADRPFRGVHHTVSIENSGTFRQMLAKHMFSTAGGGLASWYDDGARVITPDSSARGTYLLSMARYTDVYLESWLDNGADANDFNHELLYTPTSTVDGDPESLKLNRPYSNTDGALDLDDYGDDKEAYRWNFQLRNNRRRDDYTGLIAACQAFSLSGDALDVASREVLDISQWMRTFVMQSLLGNDDTYSRLHAHNFRMVERPMDGRLLAMPWDLDRVFNLSSTASLWGGDNVQKLIELPGNRRLFYGHALDMINTTYNTAYMSTWTTHYGALLNENFSSYLTYIGNRGDYFLTQLPSDRNTFTVTNANFTVATDYAVIGGQAGIAIREIYLDGLDDPVETWWTSEGEGTAQTFFWQATVPVAPGTHTLEFEAIGFQGELVGSAAVEVTSTVSERPLYDYLRVTELMYNPAVDGDLEFIEFHNRGQVTLDLTGLQLVQGVTFDFSSSSVTNLLPDAYVLVVRDLAEFTDHYNTNGLLIAGEYVGGLANGGERVTLLGELGDEIISFEYDDGRGWPLVADGAGHALVPLSLDGHDVGALNYGRNWRAGTFIGGSPGYADPEMAATVLLNEIMAHTDYTNGMVWQDSNDWIELFHAGSSAVAFADWYLSDDADDLKKWEVPAGQMIAPGEWLTFWEVSDFHTNQATGFGLNKDGEQVFLSHLPGTTNDRVVDAVAFEGQENEVSFGRYTDGRAYWYRLSPTTNAANQLPGGDIVIDEVMYNAAGNGESENPTNEFVELLNPLSVAVPLWNESGAWRLSGGIDYTFPTNTSLPVGERVVVVSFPPTNTVAMDAFRAAYDVPGGTTILGPYSGRLANGGERVALERPQASDDPLQPEDISWVIVDEVDYFDQTPWPVGADGGGRSLQRLPAPGNGNDPASWIAGLVGTPGAPPAKLAITHPTDGQGFLVPFETTVSVAIESKLVTGAVERVALQLDGVEVGSTNQPPYAFPLSGISAAGTNDLRALLVDASGTNASPIISIRVYTNAPFAEAGRDRFVNVTVGGSVALEGALDANGYPPQEIATTWLLQSGPAGVVFSDANALATTADFVNPGTYTLGLRTMYGGLVLDDFVTVTVTDSNAPNAMPYEESFESYAEGQDLDGIHGWTGEGVVETNEIPHGHPGPHPIPGATHGQALRMGKDVAVDFAGTESQSNVWVDLLVECIPGGEDGPPTLPGQDEQFAAHVTSSNGLAVWNTEGGGVWTVLPDVNLTSGQWARLTINLDYAAEPNRYRLWIDDVAVTNPRTWFVSGATNANRISSVQALGQYRLDDLVVDDYDVLNYRKVTTSGIGMGEVMPVGDVLVPIGGDTNVSFTASNYYHVGQVAVNEEATLTNAPAVSILLTNILSRQWVEGVFEPNLTPTHGVPEWWLAESDPAWTNGFDAHAGRDADGDGHLTWQELITGTHPASEADVFALAATTNNGMPVVMFEARAAGPELGGRQRYYSLEMTTDLRSGTWSDVPGYTDILGSGQTVVLTNTEPAAAYRARVYALPVSE